MFDELGIGEGWVLKSSAISGLVLVCVFHFSNTSWAWVGNREDIVLIFHTVCIFATRSEHVDFFCRHGSLGQSTGSSGSTEHRKHRKWMWSG